MEDERRRVASHKINFCTLATWRLAAGLLIAPAAPVFLISLFFFARGQLEVAQSTARILAFFTYPAAILVGLPTYFILSEKGRFGLASYLFAGFWIGMACNIFVAFILLITTAFPLLVLKNDFRLAIFPIGIALVSSGTFWLVAVSRSKT